MMVGNMICKIFKWKKNTYPWIRILRCIGRSNEGRWMVICILGKEDEWTCCVNWIYFISCVIYSFILCFIGLIYINRYWGPVCLIYHKSVVILCYTNCEEKVMQSGVIDTFLSDHQLIFCTRKIKRVKTNNHKHIFFWSLKNYLMENFELELKNIAFLNCEKFSDVNSAYRNLATRSMSKAQHGGPNWKKTKSITLFIHCSCWIYISWVNLYINCIFVTSYKLFVSIDLKSHFATRNWWSKDEYKT